MGVETVVRVGLSTASVYPENTEAGFEYAAELGYDGVELMVWPDPASQSIDVVQEYQRRYGVAVVAVHAPCLIISQLVWGTDPVAKLERAVYTAEALGARTVVVHPPFRWQRRYARQFAEQVAELTARGSVAVAVENMFPMRADAIVGPTLTTHYPSYDPTAAGYGNYTLDLSHTATAGMDALALAARMGAGLTHVHLADGRGSVRDEHLLPGVGGQPCAQLCEQLARNDFRGDVVVEVNTQRARDHDERAGMLREALRFARVHLDRSYCR